MLLGMLAHALLTNYLAVYVVFVLSVAGLVLIVRLEERELPRLPTARRAGAVPQSFPG